MFTKFYNYVTIILSAKLNKYKSFGTKKLEATIQSHDIHLIDCGHFGERRKHDASDSSVVERKIILNFKRV